MARLSDSSSPIPVRERVQAIDVLRGFAIFGILVVNMESYYWPNAYTTALSSGRWPGFADRAVARLVDIFATNNFITLLGFLFGLGFALQMLRAEARGAPFVAIQLRRSAVLLAIGLVHGLLMWWGDILILFSTLAFLLLLFRSCRPPVLLAAAAVLYAGSFLVPLPAIWEALGVPVPGGGTPGSEAALALQAVATYSHGSFADITRQRAADLGLGITYFPAEVPRRLALFVMGLWLGRLGPVEARLADPAVIRRMMLWGLVLGLGGEVLLQVLYLPGSPAWARQLATPVSAICKPALTCGYAGTLLWLFHGGARRLLAPLAAVGRMSLSNYLFQSLACTTLFYSYGFGLYARPGPAWGLALAAAIYAAQLVLSNLWARRYRFGPVEWIWRSLTYGAMQPLRLVR